MQLKQLGLNVARDAAPTAAAAESTALAGATLKAKVRCSVQPDRSSASALASIYIYRESKTGRNAPRIV